MSSYSIPNASVIDDQPLATPWESAAADQLQRRLEESEALIAECQRIVCTEKTDRVGGLNAAARIMMANAAMAARVSLLARGETRHRSIVEQIQAFPQRGQLNSKFRDPRAELEAKVEQLAREAEEEQEAEQRAIAEASAAALAAAAAE